MTARRDTQDETFSDIAAYGSRAWCAARLGKSYDWFVRNQASLREQGFPKVDNITNAFLKADVDKWIAGRSKAGTVVTVGQIESPIVINRENLNAL